MTLAIHDTWRARAVPLQPAAVAASGPAAARLGDRLWTFADDQLLRLRGVAGPGLLVLTGESTDLPWVDGVVYLGRDPQAPGLYIPTTLESELPMALVARALARRAPAAPLAVLFDPPRLVSLADARPLARARLHAWRGGA